MKTFRKTLMIVVLVCTLMIPAGMTHAAGRASIGGVGFNLNGWDGPMYLNIYATCDGGSTVYISQNGGYFQQFWSGPLNGGLWRVWTSMRPRTTYNVTFFCGAYPGSDIGVSRVYSVYFSGGWISVSRLS